MCVRKFPIRLSHQISLKSTSHWLIVLEPCLPSTKQLYFIFHSGMRRQSRRTNTWLQSRTGPRRSHQPQSQLGCEAHQPHRLPMVSQELLALSLPVQLSRTKSRSVGVMTMSFQSPIAKVHCLTGMSAKDPNARPLSRVPQKATNVLRVR